jgi:hypothetical protein
MAKKSNIIPRMKTDAEKSKSSKSKKLFFQGDKTPVLLQPAISALNQSKK